MTKTLNSHFSSQISSFLNYKRALGFLYSEEERILLSFDKLCQTDFPQETKLTQELAFCISEHRPTEGEWTRGKRIGVMREFAKYLNRIGEYAYILPTGLVREPQRYIPHIYSKKELTTIFRTIDSRKFNGHFPLNHLTMPVIFRLIYCCGLRPSEARLLQCHNINFSTREMKIIESKGHKDRLVMLSEDMAALCEKYDAHARIIYPHRKYFFHSPDYRSDGGMLSSVGITGAFKRFIKESKIPENPGNAPRLYDLRHTFATHRLYEWVANGENIDALLPVLGDYMGHEHLSHTAYYIHVAKDIYPSINAWSDNVYSEILKEAAYEI